MTATQQLLDHAGELARTVASEGGRVLIVGGYARDEALRRLGHTIETKDVDLEVYGIEAEKLVSILKRSGPVIEAGEAFKVWKSGGLDISIPRSDSKSGPGHKGFTITGDPHMSVREAARRRDLTVNALAFDPLTGELIDEWGGLADAEARILRATDPELFGDDPLRTLRLAQFAGRFGFAIDPATLDLARAMPLHELPDERIGEEWRKLLLKALKPSVGMEAMRSTAVIEKLHPEIHALIGCEQEAEWHPEGDVWVHTTMVMDEAAIIARRDTLHEDDHLTLMLAALCHDLGKPPTTEFIDGRIRSRGHSEAGEAPTRSLLSKFVIHKDTIERVVKLVLEHLWPSLNFDKQKGVITAGNAAVRRLALRLHPSSISELVRLAEADKKGRIKVDRSFPEGPVLLQRAMAADVNNTKPKPIFMGRHLIELGLEPGRHFTPLLDAVFEAQLDGHVTSLDEAIAFAKIVIAAQGIETKRLDRA